MNQDEFKAWAKNRADKNLKIQTLKVKKPRAKIIQHEKILHKECVKWFKDQYPKKMIHHSPNQFMRPTESGKKFYGVYKKMQNDLQEMGRAKGFPDLFIAEPNGKFHGLFIEMKSKSGSTSKEQRAMMDDLCERGYHCWVAKSFDEFKGIVTRYFGF